jgi:ribosomal-protein-alanine N-acetyltransferase
MEMLPYHTEDEVGGRLHQWDLLPTFGPPAIGDWRTGLPVLGGPSFTLRELELADAPTLFEHLTTEEVARFISPPPTSVAGFEKFIHWAHRQRAAGRYACFAVVPDGQSTAVGMFQISVPDSSRQVAEWGFALGKAYWGTGLFLAGAKRIVDFAFGEMGLLRLEARSAVLNGRGNGALNKLGAVLECVLRGSFERHGERLDQTLWSIAADDWWRGAPVTRGTVH